MGGNVALTLSSRKKCLHIFSNRPQSTCECNTLLTGTWRNPYPKMYFQNIRMLQIGTGELITPQLPKCSISTPHRALQQIQTQLEKTGGVHSLAVLFSLSSPCKYSRAGHSSLALFLRAYLLVSMHDMTILAQTLTPRIQVMPFCPSISQGAFPASPEQSLLLKNSKGGKWPSHLEEESPAGVQRYRRFSETEVCSYTALISPNGKTMPDCEVSHTRAFFQVCTTAGKTSGLDQTPRDLEECARHSGTTDSELSELEDKVASAAMQLQRAESEVSDIESRIAALSAAGLTVKPVEKPKKKYSTQVSVSLCITNISYFIFCFCKDGDESFDRNSIYRGSLTQRNPNGKNRKADRIFAKPVMTHRP
uniref:Rab effector MyRIP/Melanophilin domain-containing protein n=1 Tax=Gopherus evgoodei TaxID=1825980 RepID=A0A8C4W516_9SAUR